MGRFLVIRGTSGRRSVGRKDRSFVVMLFFAIAVAIGCALYEAAR
jgi:hypothetical protein